MPTDVASVPARPLPEVTDGTRHHWSGNGSDGWSILRCPACETWALPPAPICARCRDAVPTPRPASGTARLVSWTVNKQAWVPGMDVPFVVVLIELSEQEGLRMLTDLVDRDGAPVRVSDGLTIGDRIDIVFHAVADDVALPQSVLAEDA